MIVMRVVVHGAALVLHARANKATGWVMSHQLVGPHQFRSLNTTDCQEYVWIANNYRDTTVTKSSFLRFRFRLSLSAFGKPRAILETTQNAYAIIILSLPTKKSRVRLIHLITVNKMMACTSRDTSTAPGSIGAMGTGPIRLTRSLIVEAHDVTPGGLQRPFGLHNIIPVRIATKNRLILYRARVL